MQAMTDQTGIVDSRRSAGRLAMLALGLLILGAAAWHAGTLAAFRASATGTTPARLEYARLAATLGPWDERFAWRVIALEGLSVLEQGRIVDAYRLLEPYSGIVRGDPVYRDAYQAAVRAKWPLDARKAHQQHAKEQKDGYLREEDVFK
ncbi:MAG: hypothetical protein Q7W30_08205 [Coriobacteriia bacterium]|nr:hypothetical protein [Coriobacteriia bacterium]